MHTPRLRRLDTRGLIPLLSLSRMYVYVYATRSGFRAVATCAPRAHTFFLAKCVYGVRNQRAAVLFFSFFTRSPARVHIYKRENRSRRRHDTCAHILPRGALRHEGLMTPSSAVLIFFSPSTPRARVFFFLVPSPI